MNERLKDVTKEEWLEVNQINREITEEFLQQNQLSLQTLKQYKSALSSDSSDGIKIIMEINLFMI